MEAQQRATYDTLVARGCPARRLALSALDEKAFGALIMHFTLEIIFAAQLMGVNPFDQPAVEESKRLTQHYLQAGAS